MMLPSGLAIGVCSHTGLVRGANEDDYLLATPPDGGLAFIAAIADGMGGAAGGAEASRTALRALAATLLDASAVDVVDERMHAGFHAANARVSESAAAVPALRDMGTTMTALWLDPAGGVFGHIGDSRLYRVRGEVCAAMTTDHAVKEGESLLTRCIGGGQVECDSDGARIDVEAGDRFILCTDGVWNVAPAQDFAEIVGGRDAQETAERLIKCALAAGGPDNATAVVVDVLDPALTGSSEVDLPRHERPDARSLWPAAVSLRPPVWSWLVLVVAVCLLV
ncbi:MAG: serine/threonine protein phosphatase PrpC, partial [Planctomycetota bacterium]